ncbi:MAG TPA: WG repeat-containing protein [Hanamia sp.]
MEENKIVKYDGGLIKRISNQIGVTNKLLALSEPQLIPYRKGDKWGFCTPDKKMVIECIYDSAFPFSSGLAKVELKEKYGLINKQGKQIVSCKYDYIDDMSEGLAPVKLNEKWGCVNESGEEIISLKYNGLYGFIDGLAKVSLNGLYGFIDKAGKEIIPFQYNYVRYPAFVNGAAIVEIDNRYILIDKAGNRITNKVYDKIFGFVEKYAVVVLNNKKGLIDKTGKEILTCIYDSVEDFSKTFLEIYLDGEKYFYNKYKREKYNFSFDAYREGYDDYFPNDWKKEEIEEFIYSYDKKYPWKREFLEQEYCGTLFDNLGPFCEDLAWLKKGNFYGFINEDYKLVIPFIYYEVGNFNEGLAFVSNKEIEEIYRNAFDKDVHTIELEGNYGYINKAGEEVIPCKYNLANNFIQGIAKVEINGLEGYINKKGDEYWED